MDESPESLAAYPPLTKKVPNNAIGGVARTTRTISMPTLRQHESIMTNHRVSPPVKRNNDQPQINTLNNNDNTHKDPKKNMPIVDTPSGNNNYFNYILKFVFMFYLLIIICNRAIVKFIYHFLPVFIVTIFG